jgi:hypothetical protein
MQRLLNSLGAEGWYSGDSQRLVFGEYPYMQGMYYCPATGDDLYGVGTFSAFDWKPDCNEIAKKTAIKRPSTRASWQVLWWRKSSMRPAYHPTQGIYSAGIEAYEEANDRTLVEFRNGYDPEEPLRSCLEIPVFVEFCDWVIQEVGGEVAEPTPTQNGTGGLESLVQEVSVEEIDSFQETSDVSASEVDDLVPLQLPEADIKRILREIIDEPFDQKDWGGETSDLFTTRVVFRGRRTPAAFLLKGPSVNRPLHIADLGKRGDQGQRLFREPASLYLIQHVGKIASAVREHIQVLAARKARVTGANVYYCFIDGVDLARVLAAYGKIQISKDQA